MIKEDLDKNYNRIKENFFLQHINLHANFFVIFLLSPIEFHGMEFSFKNSFYNQNFLKTHGHFDLHRRVLLRDQLHIAVLVVVHLQALLARALVRRRFAVKVW